MVHGEVRNYSYRLTPSWFPLSDGPAFSFLCQRNRRGSTMFPRSRRTAMAKQRCESRLERPGQASMGLQTLSFSFSRTWQTIKDRASVIRSVDSRVHCTHVRLFVSFYELLGGVSMFHLLTNYYGNLDYCLLFGNFQREFLDF